ncbi:hypothetical protein DRE_07259 [Drechslerella stenobrocha 248]|uniref:Uncharacterized protein n=1 Tax=Drechslerella stenobrocha 248 TaxID=1043628 RepID=W7HV01_9PEZI|nr:hypothetical protein DRE_07259 [Drechslerella stenobrocha 248]
MAANTNRSPSVGASEVPTHDLPPSSTAAALPPDTDTSTTAAAAVTPPDTDISSTTAVLNFPFQWADAIQIFDAVLLKAKEANPFADSLPRDWRSQIWTTIEWHANFPKAAAAGLASATTTNGPAAPNRKIDLEEHVVTLMKGMEGAKAKGIQKINIENISTADETYDAKEKFVALVRLVYNIWQERSHSAWRQPNSAFLPPIDSSVVLPPILSASPRNDNDIPNPAALSTAASIVDRDPSVASTKSNGPDISGPAGLPSPVDTSDTISDRTEVEADASKSRSPSHSTLRDESRMITLPLATPTRPPQNIEAHPLPLAEIWRVTVNRLNGSLTKYRRPNWLLYLEARGVQTVSDIGGWREGAEGTRQLTKGLIAKLDETGYNTKPILSKIKSIATTDVSQALSNMQNGTIEKFKPVPLNLMRNAWAHETPQTDPDESGDITISGLTADLVDDSPMPSQPLKRRSETDFETPSNLVRVKRVRLASPTDLLSTPLVHPNISDANTSSTSDHPVPTRRYSINSNIPVSALVHATVEGGFTPINRAAPPPMHPPPTIERTPEIAVAATTITPNHPKPPIAEPVRPTDRPRFTPTLQLRKLREPEEAREDAMEEEQTFTSADEFESVAGDSVETFLESRLGPVAQTLSQLKLGLAETKKELAETKDAQAAQASLYKTSKEEFFHFKNSLQDHYYGIKNMEMEASQLIDQLEQAVKDQRHSHNNSQIRSADSIDNGGYPRPSHLHRSQSTGATASQTEQLEINLTTKMVQLDTQLNSKIKHLNDTADTKMYDLASKLTATMAEVRAGAGANVSDLGTKFVADMKQLENRVDADNEEVKQRIGKLESRMDSVESKIDSVDVDLKQIMDAVSGLMIKVMELAASGSVANAGGSN